MDARLRLIRKNIINNIPLYGEMHRFIPAYVVSRGVKSERWKSILDPAKKWKKQLRYFSYI